MWGCDRGGVHEPAPLGCGCAYVLQTLANLAATLRGPQVHQASPGDSPQDAGAPKRAGGPERHVARDGGIGISRDRHKSCRRDQHYPRSSVDEQDATNVEVEGSNPSGGATIKRRCNSEAGVPACLAESRGFTRRVRGTRRRTPARSSAPAVPSDMSLGMAGSA